MTPRSKINKEKGDWFECLVCHLIVSSKDLIIHNASCSNSGRKGLRFQNTLGHGFMIKNVFLAQQVELVSTGDIVRDLPPLTCKSLALIHPSAMKFCQIGIGDRVFIQGDGFDMLALAWPSQSVSPSSVHIFNATTQEKKLVAVQNYLGEIIDAVEITIKLNEVVNDKKSVAKQFVIQNSYFCVKPGSTLNCNFFGQSLTATVIDLSDGFSIYTESVDTNVVSEMMENLNISEPKKDSDSKTETPPFPQSPQDPLKNFKLAQFFKKDENHTNKCVYFCISLDTKIIIQPETTSKTECYITRYDSIGGLDAELRILRNQFDLFYNNSQMLLSYGVSPPQGILLFGPTGTGKSLILKAISNELKEVNVIALRPAELFSKFYGETEQKLKEVFENSLKMAPSLLIIDEIDVICDKGEKSTDLERRIFSSLLTLIDSLRMSLTKVLILATTSRIDILNLALRQPGRIDKEIEIPVPNGRGRFDILSKQLRTIPHILSTEDIESVAENLHSYTGADIACLIREAGEVITNSKTPRVKLAKEDFIKASRNIKPTAMKEVTIEVPKVLWSDVGGMVNVKHRLKQAIEWPLKHPEAFKRLGVKPPRGLLMYGPPGCSKTMIAKALATESGLNFLAIKGPELFNKWVGESERAVRELFRKAKAAAPSIIFFDEIDALAGERGSSSGGSNVGNRVLSQLLTEIDGVELLEGVTIIAATNRPDMIDKALLRPGRLDSVIYVPLPDTETRKEIFEIQFKKMPISSDVNSNHLVSCTDGYSGAEIVALCQEAGLAALTECLDSKEITLTHLQKALNYIKPRTSKETLKFYEEYSLQNSVAVSK